MTEEWKDIVKAEGGRLFEEVLHLDDIIHYENIIIQGGLRIADEKLVKRMRAEVENDIERIIISYIRKIKNISEDVTRKLLSNPKLHRRSLMAQQAAKDPTGAKSTQGKLFSAAELQHQKTRPKGQTGLPFEPYVPGRGKRRY